MNERRKVADPKVRERVVELVNKKGPSDTGFIATQLRISWSTARAILLNLVLEHRLVIMSTTGGSVFLPIAFDLVQTQEVASPAE